MADLTNYSKETVEHLAEAAARLKDSHPGYELQNFLFELMNEIIKTDYLDDADGKWRDDVYFKFWSLKEFFNSLTAIEIKTIA